VPYFERVAEVREPTKAWLCQFYRYFDIAVSVGDRATAAAADCIVLGMLASCVDYFPAHTQLTLVEADARGMASPGAAELTVMAPSLSADDDFLASGTAMDDSLCLSPSPFNTTDDDSDSGAKHKTGKKTRRLSHHLSVPNPNSTPGLSPVIHFALSDDSDTDSDFCMVETADAASAPSL
jgi:hypothetical protein